MDYEKPGKPEQKSWFYYFHESLGKSGGKMEK